jgi:hypothetical protein
VVLASGQLCWPPHYLSVCSSPPQVRKTRLRRPPSNYALGLGSSCANPIAGSDGFESDIPYSIISTFGKQITNVGVNEVFGSRNNTNPNNWPDGSAESFFSNDGTFDDCLLAVGDSTWNPTTTQPQSPLLTTVIVQWTQNWYIGSETNGSGVRVQEDEITDYRDHGVHIGILSPVR